MGVKETTLSGAEGNGEYLGNLLQAQIIYVAQDDDLAVGQAQRLEHLEQIVGGLIGRSSREGSQQFLASDEFPAFGVGFDSQVANGRE